MSFMDDAKNNAGEFIENLKNQAGDLIEDAKSGELGSNPGEIFENVKDRLTGQDGDAAGDSTGETAAK